jgi:hypothetical protein
MRCIVMKLLFMALQHLVGRAFLVIGASQSHSIGHTALGWTSLKERSARHRTLYLTTNNTHTRHTSMPPEGFEPAILASELPQTHALDRAAAGIDYEFTER